MIQTKFAVNASTPFTQNALNQDPTTPASIATHVTVETKPNQTIKQTNDLFLLVQNLSFFQ